MTEKLIVVIWFGAVLFICSCMCCFTLMFFILGVTRYAVSESNDYEIGTIELNSYKDDFISGEWYQGEGSDEYGSYSAEVNKGKYSIKLSTLKPVNRRFTNDNYRYENVEVSLDGDLLYGPENSDYGIVLRYQDDDNYYMFSVNEGYGQYSFKIRYKGEWYDIANWVSSNKIEADGNNLKIEANDSEFKLYINGYNLATYYDYRISKSGEIGIAIDVYQENNEASYSFGNFEITSL